MNKKYAIAVLSFSIISLLIVAMVTTTLAVTTVKDVQKIIIFSTDTQANLRLYSDSEFVFGFNPLGIPTNITKVYVTAIIFHPFGHLTSTRFWITINGHTEYFGTSIETDSGYLTGVTVPISSSDIIDSIHRGINTFQMTAEGWASAEWWKNHAYQLIIFIEYEYQTASVGGFTIPVDKFCLVAPYLAIVSTIIIAVSISVAYVKYRKK